MRKPTEDSNRSPRTSLSTVDKQSVSLNHAVHIYNLKLSSKLKNPTAPAGGDDTPKQVSQSLDIKAGKKSSVTPSMAAIKKSLDDSSTARKHGGLQQGSYIAAVVNEGTESFRIKRVYNTVRNSQPSGRLTEVKEVGPSANEEALRK